MENDTKKIIICVGCKGEKHSFFSRKNNFDLYKCLTCKHISIYPIEKNTKYIYEDDYFTGAHKGMGYVDYDTDKEPMRYIFLKYIDLIDRYIVINERERSLLDVGAATGFFIDIVKNQWNDKQNKIQGVEISEYAAEIGRNKGLDITTGTLQEYKENKDSLNVVTMLDVLEHFPDPDIDIKKSFNILKKHGLLVINTPDSGSLYAKILGKNWHLIMPPEHINYFNRKSVQYLLERNGFEVLLITTIGKKFTLSYILHIVFAWTHIRFFQNLATRIKKSKRISKISFPINLFDNMFIISRKR